MVLRPRRRCPARGHPREGRLHLYDADHDDDHHFADVAALERWLDDHEHEHEGFTALQEELFDHLLPLEVDKWAEEAPPER